jgi:hypothetical protein
MAWHDTLDNDTRAALVAKGWDRLDGDNAAQAIFKSYQNLEKSRPSPDTILSARNPTEYSFDGIKYGDGDPDPDAVAMVRQIATDLKLPPATARELATRLFASGHAEETAQQTAAREATEQATARLKTTWGDKYEANTAVAANAFEKLALPKETVDALVGAMGVDKAMEFGHTLGSRMGEAPLLAGGGQMQTTPMSREAALTKRNALMGDAAFAKKIMDGDVTALKELEDVSRAIITDAAAPGGFQKAPDNFGRTKENPNGVFEAPKVA